LIYGIFSLPGDASIAMAIGFFRKDLAVGMLISPVMNPL